MPRDRDTRRSRSRSPPFDRRRGRDRSRSRDRHHRSRSRSRDNDRRDSGRYSSHGLTRDGEQIKGRYDEHGRDDARERYHSYDKEKNYGSSKRDDPMEKERKARMELAERLAKNGVEEEKHIEEGLNTQEEAADDEDEEAQMMRLMGFGTFDSTKGKPVDDNFATAATGAANKSKKRVYRQYMNRRGGFNKPLAKMN